MKNLTTLQLALRKNKLANEWPQFKLSFSERVGTRLEDVQLIDAESSISLWNRISESIKTNLIPGTYIYRIINNGKLIYDGKLIRE